MKKLKAFTLLELVIGMIIGSLVTGFCYSAYSIVSRQYISYKKTRKEITAAMDLNTLLSSDFLDAKSIRYTDNMLHIEKGNGSSPDYLFVDSAVIRTFITRSDTFYVKPVDIKSAFFNEENNETTWLINEFSFNGNVVDESQHFHFYKKYSAETLLTTTDHGN